MRLIAIAFLGLLLLSAISARAQAVDREITRAVLVTGASTGIGRKITEHLAADGYIVYAGARKDADIQSLGAIRNVHALRLDVTKSEDIDEAVRKVSLGRHSFIGLVNNAGVATVGGIARTSWSEFDLVMAVNVYGPYRVTKAFLPLIIAHKGRIVNIGSVAGITASPELSAYAMSKHAIEAFSDSLAQETAPFGVQVSIIEPGNYDSEIFKSAEKRTGVASRLSDRSKYKQADEVANAVEEALFQPSPKRRYLVVPDRQEAESTIRKQIEQLVQLNEGQPFTYDRETLIKMLDDGLTHARPRTN